MKGLHNIIACRFNNRKKYSLTHERKWIELTDGLEISETIYQANGWEKPRRIVMVRQEIDNDRFWFKEVNEIKKKIRQK